MRFFVWNMKDFGLGSDLHTLGYALAIAIKQNRVLVLGPDWRYNSQSDELCKDAKSLNCFAAPISNCTLDDVGYVRVTECLECTYVCACLCNFRTLCC